MWLRLWAITALITLSFHQIHAAPTSVGPTSEEESIVLWGEGDLAVQQSKFSDAIPYLQRLIDRYPGTRNYLQAHLLLGRSYFETKRCEEAVPPLKYFISANGMNPSSAKARLWLGQCYLELKKFHESDLTTRELDQMDKKLKLSSDIILENLLIKSQALFGLRYENPATAALESALRQLTAANSALVRGKAFNLQLRYKFLVCSRFPSSGPLDETQIRDQLDRRGTCLLETLLVFKNILDTKDAAAVKLAVDQTERAFTEYQKICSAPPLPPQIQKSKVALQKKRFRVELADRLILDFRNKTALAQEMIGNWKPKLSQQMREPAYEISKTLKTLAEKNP